MAVTVREDRKQASEYSQSRSHGSPSFETDRHNVLQIVPSSFFADYGCHVRIFEETRVLQSRGHRVAVCAYNTGEDIPDLEIHRALKLPWHNTVKVGSSKRKLYYDVLLSAKCAEVALRRRPSVIHAHLHEGALIGYPLSRLHRIPLIFDFQGSLTSEMLDHGFLRRESSFFGPLRKLEWVIDRMADAIITSSQNAADILMKEFACSSKKIFTVTDCVNSDFFVSKWESGDGPSLARLRASLGIPADRKLVVYLGLLAEYQGIGRLLEAAQILVSRGLPVHFLIMGFPAVEMYRGIASQLGLADYATFTGKISYWQAPKYLQLGDVAVSPKMSETEGNGKLLNYMATGLPTVAFDTPVAQELLGDLGVFARVGSSEALANSLEELLTDEQAARQRGQALRRRATERYSWAGAGERIEEIYRRVCR